MSLPLVVLVMIASCITVGWSEHPTPSPSPSETAIIDPSVSPVVGPTLTPTVTPSPQTVPSNGARALVYGGKGPVLPPEMKYPMAVHQALEFGWKLKAEDAMRPR